jgi:hypothetical protein
MTNESRWEDVAAAVAADVLPLIGAGERLSKVAELARRHGVSVQIISIEVFPFLEGGGLIKRDPTNRYYVKK